MFRDRLLLGALLVVWTAVIVVGVLFLRPVTSAIYSHQGPEYELKHP